MQVSRWIATLQKRLSLAKSVREAPSEERNVTFGWPFPDRRPHMGFRLLGDNLWLPIMCAWFLIYLTIVFATSAIDLSVIPSPRMVQGLLALALLVLVSAIPYLRFQWWFDWIRHDRLLHQQARAAIREARRLRASHSALIPERSEPFFDKARERLAEALAVGRPQQIYTCLAELDRLVDSPRPLGCPSSLREYSLTIGIALLIAQCLRAFLADGYGVNTTAMLPTLQAGDQILVSKTAYGIRLPFSKTKRLTKQKNPQRGDVVVFRSSENDSLRQVSRVVGLPGDVVEVCDREVRLNGAPLQTEPLTGFCSYEPMAPSDTVRSTPRPCTAVSERIGTESYLTLYPAGAAVIPRGCMAPVTVPADSVFTLSDNRAEEPARHIVPIHRITGKASVIIWSQGETTSIRKERMGVPVHCD